MDSITDYFTFLNASETLNATNINILNDIVTTNLVHLYDNSNNELFQLMLKEIDSTLLETQVNVLGDNWLESLTELTLVKNNPDTLVTFFPGFNTESMLLGVDI